MENTNQRNTGSSARGHENKENEMIRGNSGNIVRGGNANVSRKTIFTKPRGVTEIGKGDKIEEDKYSLLKRKIHREPGKEKEVLLSSTNSQSVDPKDMMLVDSEVLPPLKLLQKLSLASEVQRKHYSFQSSSNLSTFKYPNLNCYPKFNNFRISLKSEKKFHLSIIKSNVSLGVITKNYIVTKNGIPNSHKTHNTHYISIGRQQVNDQGIRPNDIMLFPTDPSISRSHFKIYHKEYFNSKKEFAEKLMTMLRLTSSSQNNSSQSWSNKTSNAFNGFNSFNDSNALMINEMVLYGIMAYIAPRNKVAIEDNGTIYGTYVKVRCNSIRKLLVNFLLTMKSEGVLEDVYGDNFTLSHILESIKVFSDNETYSPHEKKLIERLSMNKKFLTLTHSKNAPMEISPRIHSDKLLDFLKFSDCKNFWSRVSLQSDRQLFLDNNLILNNFLPAVFLNNSKGGFIVLEIGDMPTIIEALKIEYQSFNEDNYHSTIDIISLEKIFEFQKIDISSHIFKGTVSKEELVYNLQYLPYLHIFSFLLFIETAGDPCGVMNRINEVLFLCNKKGVTSNKRSFSFNFIKGFLIGNNPKSCYVTSSEVDTFIFYNPEYDKWVITDLTKYLNPALFYSEEFFGLWICSSPDKRAENRFTPKKFYVEDGDEIKISETVMKINIGQENDIKYYC